MNELDHSTVMISSTFSDLAKHREAVNDALHRLGFSPISMEFDSARAGRNVIESSMEMLEGAHAYVGILGHRYGGVPEDKNLNPENLSITELEYRRALQRGIPVFMYLMSDDHPVKLQDIEIVEEYRKKLRDLKEEAKSRSICAEFSSVESLKSLVLQSMSEFKLSTAATERPARPSLQVEDASKLPEPPRLFAIPDFVSGQAFVGRTQELAWLDQWAASTDSLMVIEAIGGAGKSTLAWQWLTHRARHAIQDLAGALWYSFYEGGADMSAFAAYALAYITRRPLKEFRGRKTADLAPLLVPELQARPWLLALEGFERVLVAYHPGEASREDSLASDVEYRACVNSSDADLLRQFVAAAPSKILVTSRLMPAALTNRAGSPMPGVRHRGLGGIQADDALQLMRDLGIRGDQQKIRAYLVENFDNHPLVLGIVAGLVNDYIKDPGNFDRWVDDPQGGAGLDLAKLKIEQRHTHILAAAFNGLEPSARDLLSRIAGFSEPVVFETIEALNPFQDVPGLVAGLRDLERRGLLTWDRTKNSYDLHRVVRGYAFDAAVTAEYRPTKMFVSYSPEDEAFRAELDIHLTALKRSGLIETWSDNGRRIGESRRDDLDPHFERATIILLLVSPDFLESDYGYGVVTKRALERDARGDARAVPILLRDSAWRETDLAFLQGLPADGQSISGWKDRDAAWKVVVAGIETIVRQVRSGIRPKKALSIASIVLENIRCFPKLTMNFNDARRMRFAVIFGENGIGKSTILRSLALGLCSETKAAAVLEMLAGDLLRTDAQKGSIRIELIDSAGKIWTCTTFLERGGTQAQSNRSSGVTLRRETVPGFPQDSIFICGYGAGRRSIGTSDPAPEYEIDSAVRTLFDYSTPLQNPELIFRRLVSLGKSVSELMLKIDAALGLEPGSATLDPTGIRIQGPWGSFVPVGALGDGYQATLAWLSDFFGHHGLFDKDCPLAEISGIVLVDELEQHLHPRWQRSIVETLHRQFPNIQFIATSHSPVCAGGLADLPAEEQAYLFVLERSGGRTTGASMRVPTGMRYDEIMTSPVIGLDTARDRTTSKLFEQLHETFEKSGADPEQNPEFVRLMQALEERSVTAAEEAHTQYVEEQLLSSAEDVERAIREARDKNGPNKATL